jgi:phage gp29-like protein
VSTDWRAESSLVPSRLDGAIDRVERYRVPGRFGDLTAGQLSAILYKLDQGWLDDWADLCEFALCDDTLMSLYASRSQRVLQATWKVKPNQFGDPRKAQLAAEFCNEQLGRLLNPHESMRYMLHALAVGLSCSALEWDSYRATTGQQTYYMRKTHFRHPHRFRYDDQWKPRLWDGGQYLSTGTGFWGKVLDPRKWLVHQHYEIVGYPNVSGFMRGAIWVWMFRRWADKFGIMSLEKYGNPFLYAQVPPNTPRASREQIRQDLEDLSNDHAGVMDQGTTIMSLAGMSGQSDSMHGAFMDRYEKRLARLILGTSDAADPGANGSNAAVATRTGSMTDPRMVSDGVAAGETWASTVFHWTLEFNRHRFGGELLPCPTFEAQTASDEVKTDKQDLAEQGGLPPNIPGGSGQTPPPPTASDGSGPPGNSNVSEAALARPKALSRSAQGRRTVKPKTRTRSPQTPTSPTSSASADQLALTLLGPSADPRR